MRTRCSFGGGRRAGWVLATLAAVALLPVTAFGAERVVLCEEFTATWCSHCANAGQRFSQLMNNYPDVFAFVQIHHGDNYATAWGNQRANFYGLTGYPTDWFDGVISHIGEKPYSVYEAALLARLSIATDVTIDLTAVETAAQTYEFTANVCLQPGGTAKTLRIYMVQVLDFWPIPPAYSRNGFRQAAATQDVNLTPGNCVQVVRTFTFPTTPDWDSKENIKVIAWAQMPYSQAPAEVHQAAMLQYPFNPCGNQALGDANCDGTVDGFDIQPFVLALTDPNSWIAQYPNCDILCVCDANCDGTVDGFDIQYFVGCLTNGSCECP